jgi:hypothetical protein
MGFLGGLFKRQPPEPPSFSAAMQALSRATPRLQSLETLSTGVAGVLIRDDGWGGSEPLASIDRLLRAYAPAQEASTRLETDEHGYHWITVRHQWFDGLAAGIRMVGEAFLKQDYGERIVAAVFPFMWKEKKVYLIYLPGSGRFSPFVPVSKQDDLRDLPLESRMEQALRRDIPTERDMSQWYPMWDMPI